MENTKKEMYFTLKCQNCGNEIELPESRKGDWVKCKKCETMNSVPINGLYLYPTPKIKNEEEK